MSASSLSIILISAAIKRSNNSLSLLTLYGIGLFIIFYFIAAALYPGGSFGDKTIKGFSWLHNYWCELMAPRAQNGAINTARPVAIIALIILSGSLSLFWYNASGLYTNRHIGHYTIRYPGIFSMLFLFVLFTGQHDLVMNISGAAGILALCSILLILYRKRSYRLVGLGIACIVLCVVNNYIYYGNHFMYYLPVIQKISFGFFLLWFALVTLYIGKTGIKRPIPENAVL